MTDLEQSLRDTLDHASGRAPQAPSTLAVHLETGHRRRRRRVQALTAAAAVVVVTAGATFALRGGETRPSPAATASATPSVASLPAQRVEQVWPDAVTKIPRKLPDGRGYQPLLLLDDGTMLVGTSSSFEKADGLYAYDLGTNEVRKITDVITPKGSTTFSSDFALGEGHIVWWTSTDAETSIWAAPVAGGEAKLLATAALDPGGIDRLAVSGGKVYLSQQVKGGVFSVPLDGGTVERVERAGDYHVLAWPWVGSDPTSSAHVETNAFVEILNLETGERDTAVVNDGEVGVRCDVLICTGQRGDEGFFRRRDGSGERAIPAWGGGSEIPAQSRFYTSVVDDGVALTDMNTGKSADLGLRPDKKGTMTFPYPAGDGRLLSYTLGDQVVVVDLDKLT